MADDYKNYNLPEGKKVYMTEEEVRELIAASLANWTGITRFRTIESTITIISDFTDSQHNHQNAAGGGQLTKDAISGTIDVPHGGTGVNTIPSGEILIGAGAGAVTTLATLTVAKGGTGAGTFTSGHFLKGNGTGAVGSQAPGLSATYSFGGGASGDIATITVTNGLITAVTTVP